MRPRRAFGALAWVLLVSISAAAAPILAPPTAALKLRPCWLRGHPHEARCGVLPRPLDPSQPAGRQIGIHVAVVPALAQQPAPDPVFFLVGGSGQSAIDLAGALAARYSRLATRRDLVFVDQRGTGRSAPLRCAEDDERAAWQPLVNERERIERLTACRETLQRLPYGDLRDYTTTIAMADLDAVRAALGVERINAIGYSYGTRALLEYQRRFGQRLRRVVLDGVAPPDMPLPATAGADTETALDALFDDCARDADCARRFPGLRQRWQFLLASLPREVRIEQPLSGQPQTVAMTRPLAFALVRAPLYAPALAAALPQALSAAAAGHWQPLVSLSSALAPSGDSATGMHFSVVCAEDQARIEAIGAKPAAVRPGAPASGQAGDGITSLYREVCANWPRGDVPAAFYHLTEAQAPTLLLYGGDDPATPPRHVARVLRALGARAREVIVPHAGHGVLALPCLRDTAMDFITAADDRQALALDLGCAAAVPRPRVFVPAGAGA